LETKVNVQLTLFGFKDILSKKKDQLEKSTISSELISNYIKSGLNNLQLKYK
jgi:hypothetical protein